MTTQESPAVENWMAGIGERTRTGYLWHFEAFMKWVREQGNGFSSMTPDDMVEYALDGTTREINKLLDLKKRYLLSMTGRASHKHNADKAIKSFFMHSRCPLPTDSTLNVKGDRPRVEGTLSPEDVKRVIMASNELYQSVFLVMLGSGMGQAELVNWSDTGYDDLITQLRGSPEVVKVSLHGRKGDRNEYNYHTYIGGDALDALRRYLQQRGVDPGAIFINTHNGPLTEVALYRYWTRKLHRLGISVPGNGWQGKHVHELRDTYRTLWRRSGVPVEYGEYFMGHRDAFDAYGYDKTAQDEDETRKRYLQALPMLNILSETRPFKLVHEDTVEKLRRENEELQRKLEQQGRDALSMFKDLEQRLKALERR
jgi:integrase